MSLSGTRGLIRISLNDGCELQAAMVVKKIRELEFYRRVTGTEFPREYGERIAARRRGAKFEANLHRNDAALLRKVLGPIYDIDPDSMIVRNFADEIPGARLEIRAMRLYRFRRILRDLSLGRNVPDLLIQPQLCLPTGNGRRDIEYVSPDFLVFDRKKGMYRPGEEKSFIVRNGVADRADLDGTRRQAAAQILALQSETSRFRLESQVDDKATFVFATPYGLAPAPPFEESLRGELREMREAVGALIGAKKRLQELQRTDDAPLHMLVDELRINFQDSCIGTCVMADFCRRRYLSQTRVLGDQVSELLGPDMEIGRVVELLKGGTAASDRERQVMIQLKEATDILPRLKREARRRIA
jgi:hypothetical protein